MSWIIAPILNVFVVVMINFIYVFLYLQQSSNVIIVLQILLAMFKSFWNGLGYRYLSRLLNFRFDVDNLSLSHSSLQLFIRLLNNTVIPCVVVAVINPGCFFNLFVAAPPVITDFRFRYCDIVNIESAICVLYDYKLQTTKLDPPYNYSYQCSSRFVTSYAPAFVFMCLIDGLLVPLLRLFSSKVYVFGVDNNKYWSKYLAKVIPRILKVNKVNSSDKAERNKLHPLFDSLQLFLDNFTYLGLLMTFGAVFPPLAFTFFVTIYLMNRFALFKLDRFLVIAIEKNRLDYIAVIEQECKGCLNNKVIMR